MSLKDLPCLVKLILLSIKYKFENTRESFWVWSFSKVSDPSNSLYENKCLIKYLLVDAIESLSLENAAELIETHEEFLKRNNMLDKIIGHMEGK